MEGIPDYEPSWAVLARVIDLSQTTRAYVHPHILTFRTQAELGVWTQELREWIQVRHFSPYMSGFSGTAITSLFRVAPLRANVWLGLVIDPCITAIEVLCGFAPDTMHAWAFASIRSRTGERRLLIYSSEPVRRYHRLMRYQQYLARVMQWQQHAELGTPTIPNVYHSRDNRNAHQRHCLRLSVHWLRFIARFGDLPLQERDPRLEGFGRIRIPSHELYRRRRRPAPRSR